jgi:hypothetical protein
VRLRNAQCRSVEVVAAATGVGVVCIHRLRGRCEGTGRRHRVEERLSHYEYYNGLRLNIGTGCKERQLTETYRLVRFLVDNFSKGTVNQQPSESQNGWPVCRPDSFINGSKWGPITGHNSWRPTSGALSRKHRSARQICGSELSSDRQRYIYWLTYNVAVK